MEMPEVENRSLRVALISSSTKRLKSLKKILGENGMQVVDDDELRPFVPDRLDHQIADVLLINLDDSDEDDPALDAIIEQTELPILFHDSASTLKHSTASGKAWGRRLTSKLWELAQDQVDAGVVTPPPGAGHSTAHFAAKEAFRQADDLVEFDESAYNDEDHQLTELEMAEFADDSSYTTVAEPEREEGFPVEALMATVTDPYQRREPSEIELDEVEQAYWQEEVVDAVDEPGMEDPEDSAEHQYDSSVQVWVLGASIGGPQAVKRFLGGFTPIPGVAFVLAQHIGPGFVPLLAEQLDRVTELEVIGAQDNQRLMENQLVVAPVEGRITFNAAGEIELQPVLQRSIYSPCIDDVMREVAQRFGPNAGAIVFSGMGNDGTEGCSAIVEHGGMVWAQDAESCVISSMADSVRETGIVSLSGTPEELAEQLMKHLQNGLS